MGEAQGSSPGPGEEQTEGTSPGKCLCAVPCPRPVGLLVVSQRVMLMAVLCLRCLRYRPPTGSFRRESALSFNEDKRAGMGQGCGRAAWACAGHQPHAAASGAGTVRPCRRSASLVRQPPPLSSLPGPGARSSVASSVRVKDAVSPPGASCLGGLQGRGR